MYITKPNKIINKLSLIIILLLTINITTSCAPLMIAGVATGATVLTDRRTTGTYIEDQAIEFKAAQYFRDNQTIAEQSNVYITSYNERVLLTGYASSNYIKNQIEDAIKNIPKVKTIYNEIKIAKLDKFKYSSYDTWITTKIKTRLTGNSKVSPLDIKVHTNNSEVYLMGLVDPAEAEAATNIARTTNGVTKVVKLFEYIEPAKHNQNSYYAER